MSNASSEVNSATENKKIAKPKTIFDPFEYPIAYCIAGVDEVALVVGDHDYRIVF